MPYAPMWGARRAGLRENRVVGPGPHARRRGGGIRGGLGASSPTGGVRDLLRRGRGLDISVGLARAEVAHHSLGDALGEGVDEVCIGQA